MTANKLRRCSRGHQYYKSSDCPVCPLCEEERKPTVGMLSLIPAPARRALERLNIRSAQDLSGHTEKEISALHGMGPAGIRILRKILSDHSLEFKKQV